MRVKIPANQAWTSEPAEVDIAKDGTVTYEDEVIGTVTKGYYTSSPPAAGFGGRIVRYHKRVSVWEARLPGVEGYRRHSYRSYYPNTRRDCLSWLLHHH